MTICAICASTISGPVILEPLGRNDAMVAVCERCATEPVVAYRGPERSYEGAGPSLSTPDARAALVKMVGEERYERDGRINDKFSRAPSGQPGDEWFGFIEESIRRKRRSK